MVFFIDRVVDLYMFTDTSSTPTYMFQKEELAEELFTTKKKHKYRTFHVANKL
jgi:hypothetical protein